MKPWRENAVPHRDVLAGTFQQSEFAADLSAVRAGKAPPIYQDARTFFERTFITEGMRLLLTQVAERLNGRGGEPVVQLQTSFGGGKTHTLLAVYHLATRTVPLRELPGIPTLLDAAGLLDVPHANVAVLDGNAQAPGQPWKRGGLDVHTLWGELAWQLGGADGYELLRQADLTGTSPGKDVMVQLLSAAAPCVVLVDELVAYVRQFSPGVSLSGGSYDTNLSFVQALTEATKLVPNAIILASLPESELEVGSAAQGAASLRALEKLFGRVQALWKPVGIEESFEIVRRRLFMPVTSDVVRDEVCAAFAALYHDEGARLPSETHEGRYVERLRRAYPIHPEFFDRLYEDWSTLESFQRTRGVLKLMARVIFRLWKDQNSDVMVLPSSLPLYDGGARNELTYHLGAGWDPVIDRDIDGERAESTALDTREPRFGATQAARRVARTVFLASAPSSVATRSGNTRGVERGRVLLGCLQPGQSSAAYSDALNRLADRLHYLNTSGDKTQDGTRFWFDVRANLRREMEDRKGRFDERADVRPRIKGALDAVAGKTAHFDAVHIFVPHADVPDDSSLRLVLLDPGQAYSKQEPRPAADAVLAYVEHHGSQPRFRSNRLLFVAPDASVLGRLKDAVRTSLAWASIVSDIDDGRLNVDGLRHKQAKKESESAGKVVEQAARDCYKWVLAPVLKAATDRKVEVEVQPMNSGAKSFIDEVQRVCVEHEFVIEQWSEIHLRNELKRLYWKGENNAARAFAVRDDMQRYLYLSRLRSAKVFDAAVIAGARSKDFFGVASGEAAGRFEGLFLGVTLDRVHDTHLLVEPAAAQSQLDADRQAERARSEEKARLDEERRLRELGKETGSERPTGGETTPPTGPAPAEKTIPPVIPLPPAPKPARFTGSVPVTPMSAKAKLHTLADEIVALLTADPNATVSVTLEISADFPKGVSDSTRRAVSENARVLGFTLKEWE